jgi:hypothetical protein
LGDLVPFRRPGAAGADRAALALWGLGPLARRRGPQEPAVECEQLPLFAVAVAAPPPAAPEAAVRVAALPVGRGGWLERWQVASATRPGVFYTVGRRSGGEMGCSCQGWIYHVPRPACRHIRAVLEAGG